MNALIQVTGTYQGEPYALDIIPGDVWPTDRSPVSSKVAAIVMCSKGERYAPAPSCASVTLDLADPRTVLACLANETKIDSITPDTQFVPDPDGPPGSADGPSAHSPGTEPDEARHMDFTMPFVLARPPDNFADLPESERRAWVAALFNQMSLLRSVQPNNGEEIDNP